MFLMRTSRVVFAHRFMKATKNSQVVFACQLSAYDEAHRPLRCGKLWTGSTNLYMGFSSNIVSNSLLNLNYRLDLRITKFFGKKWVSSVNIFGHLDTKRSHSTFFTVLLNAPLGAKSATWRIKHFSPIIQSDFKRALIFCAKNSDIFSFASYKHDLLPTHTCVYILYLAMWSWSCGK